MSYRPRRVGEGILVRALVPGFIGRIPLAGPIFKLVNALFIFGEERQCLHDKLAGTKVLDCALMNEVAWTYAGRPRF